ncbi:MAG: hypothetical protein ACJ8M1_11655 [Chthoniobacterales bacterium]
MRGIYKFKLGKVLMPVIGILTFAVPLVVAAQNPPAAGFFTLVNAVDLTSNTVVSVDGRPLRPDGLKPGQVTGGLGFVAGRHRIDATNIGCRPGSLMLDVNEGTSPIVIIYLISSSSPTGTAARELRLFVRRNTPGTTEKKTFWVIYAGAAASQTVTLNAQTVKLQPLIEASVGDSASLTIGQNGQPVASLVPDVPGKYVGVLFDGRDSKLKAVLAEDAVLRRAGTR